MFQKKKKKPVRLCNSRRADPEKDCPGICFETICATRRHRQTDKPRTGIQRAIVPIFLQIKRVARGSNRPRECLRALARITSTTETRSLISSKAHTYSLEHTLRTCEFCIYCRIKAGARASRGMCCCRLSYYTSDKGSTARNQI